MKTSTDNSCRSEETAQKITLWNELATSVAVYLPPAGVVAALIFWWYQGVAVSYFMMSAVSFLITGFGITCGFHRLLTHQSFTPRPWVRIAFGIAGSMALEGSVFDWCTRHNEHHQKSDAEGDPHSPHGFSNILRGLIHAHVGWIPRIKPPMQTDYERYIPHLLKDKGMVFVNRHFPWWVALRLILPTIIGIFLNDSVFVGAFLGFLFGAAVSIFFVHHVTWSINSLCHWSGRQEFKTGDHSTNNVLCALVGLGEGWHNNHHAFRYSARHGLAWWQLDLTFILIKILEKLGLASRVLVPTAAQIEKARLR